MTTINTGLIVALTVYTVVHCVTYCWYQSRKRRAVQQRNPNAALGKAVDDTPLRRRVASGIHRPWSRRRALLLVAVIVAGLVVACMVGTAVARHF